MRLASSCSRTTSRTHMNRYAPSSAVTRDFDELARRKPPVQVAYAVMLLWASSLLSIGQMLLEELPVPSVGSVGSAVFLVAISAALYPRIHRGANWARLVGLLLSVINTGALIYSSSLVALHWRLDQIGDLVSTACDVIAMCLLFARPGSTWFGRFKRL